MEKSRSVTLQPKYTLPFGDRLKRGLNWASDLARAEEPAAKKEGEGEGAPTGPALFQRGPETSEDR